MPKKNWLKSFRLNIHAPGTGFALMILALTQVPVGIKNAAATCGTAFTKQHFSLIKALGIRRIYLNFDWDNAGFLATQRVLENVLKKTNGLSVYITLPPSESFEDYNDLSTSHELKLSSHL